MDESRDFRIKKTTNKNPSHVDIDDFIKSEGKNLNTLKEKQSAKKARLDKTRKESTKKTIKNIIFVAIIVLAIIAAVVFAIMQLLKVELSETGKENKQKTAIADEIYYSPLTGREVASAELTKAAATCVMIENSPDARPQSGLSEAGVVYEAIAEGGITRFMAIYQEAKPELLGPVRSLRLTFAEFAKPYQCSIAHVGGSGNALNLVRNNSAFRDLDETYNAGSFWRASSKPNGTRIYAPHNAYTNFERIDAFNFSKGYANSDFSGFLRTNPDAVRTQSEQNATTVRINISSATYNPVYFYDAEQNNYKRAFASGQVHNSIFSNGQEVQNTPDVVIALKTNAYARSSETQYNDYTTIGENEAYIFQNGNVVVGKWRRADANSELKFYDSADNEIALNRGQVWISIYPGNAGGSVSWE